MQSTPLSSIDRKILLLLQHNADLSAAERIRAEGLEAERMRN